MKQNVLRMRTIMAALALTLALVAAGGPRAQGAGQDASGPAPGLLVPVSDKTDAAWLAQARANYPLSVCSVSGDKLGDAKMGKAHDYVFKQDGKPDRLVRFCCSDCVKDFNKDPAKYLKIIDEAAAKAGAK